MNVFNKCLWVFMDLIIRMDLTELFKQLLLVFLNKAIAIHVLSVLDSLSWPSLDVHQMIPKEASSTGSIGQLGLWLRS